MDKKEITGFVLAGGKSSRMGIDKSLLVYKGKPLVQYAVEAILPFCSRIYISTNNPDYNFKGYELIPDSLPQQAPMIGIYSCLKKSKTDLNIFLSCDMPLISNSLFEYLISNSTLHDTIVPIHNNNLIEPLCGIYKRNLLPSLEGSINNQDFSLHKFIEASNHLKLNINSDLEFYNKAMFSNINTIEDFNSLSLL